MSNPPSEHEEDEEEQLNIGTLFRYVLGEEDSPIPHRQVVIGPDVVADLSNHIGTGTSSCPPASGGNQPVVDGPSTSSGVQGHLDPLHPNFHLLHRSLRQRIGAAGYHHVLNPHLTWEDFSRDIDNRYSASRSDPTGRSVRFVKPIYSSYVNLLDITLSDTTSSSHRSAHSEHSQAPLQGILANLGIDNINWENIEIDNQDLIVYQPPPIEEEEDFSEEESINIDDIIEDPYNQEDQLLIDLGHPRLIDNPRDVWWVSDPPPSPNQTNSTSTKDSLTSSERRRRQQQSDDDRDSDTESSTTTPTASSIIRDVRRVVVPAPAQSNKIEINI